MKKLLVAGLLSLAAVTLGRANPLPDIVDSNPANVYLSGLPSWLGGSASYQGEFTLAGYNPATMTVTGAEMVFKFFDFGGSESFNIKLNLTPTENPTVFTSGSIGLTFTSPTLNVTGDALVTLDVTGALKYTVTRTSGEFWLDNAKLTAHIAERHVPDGATTAMLLGLGLVGIALAARLQLKPIRA